MTPTGFRYAICSLKAERGRIAGELASLAIQIAHRERDLAKVDDALRLLDPDSDPSKIPPNKNLHYLNCFKQGELGRLIVSLLRQADEPMTNLEIARAVMEIGGYSDALWTGIRRRTRANLAYLEEQRRVVKSGNGINALWSYAEKVRISL